MPRKINDGVPVRGEKREKNERKTEKQGVNGRKTKRKEQKEADESFGTVVPWKLAAKERRVLV